MFQVNSVWASYILALIFTPLTVWMFMNQRIFGMTAVMTGISHHRDHLDLKDQA